MDAEERLHLRVLGWCLKQRRRGCHLSQVALAALAYLSRGEVQHLEHARHGMREGTKFRISIALDTSVVEIDAEVVRVKQNWKDHGPPKGYEEA